jgi:acetate---CoA ligase (ADP-forming) subunit beta
MSKTRGIFERSIALGRRSLLEHEAEKLAANYGISTAKSVIANSEKEAGSFSLKIGYPVVLKIVSPDILHKTDIGGVKVGIKSQAEAKEAYHTIIKNTRRAKKDATIVGVLVQKMAPPGQEYVVGATRDPQFGPTVMFGLGGIYVELFQDVSFRFAPMSEKDSVAMILELKSAPLLTGFRGSKPLDLNATSKVIRSVGKMMVDNQSIDSIDINPLFVYTKGALATDVRVILRNQRS